MIKERLPADVIRAHKGKSFVGVSTAIAILNKRGELFMAKRSENTRDEHGTWDICGGGLKWGVNLQDNIVREMSEEFAVKTNEPLHFLGVREAFRVDQHNEDTHWVCIDYLVVVTDEESANVRINESDNFTDSGWFSLEKLPTPRHSVLTDDYFLRLNSYFNKLVTATA